MEEKSVVVGDGDTFQPKRGDLGSGLLSCGLASGASCCWWKAGDGCRVVSRFPRFRCGGVGLGDSMEVPAAAAASASGVRRDAPAYATTRSPPLRGHVSPANAAPPAVAVQYGFAGGPVPGRGSPSILHAAALHAARASTASPASSASSAGGIQRRSTPASQKAGRESPADQVRVPLSPAQSATPTGVTV